MTAARASANIEERRELSLSCSFPPAVVREELSPRVVPCRRDMPGKFRSKCFGMVVLTQRKVFHQTLVGVMLFGVLMKKTPLVRGNTSVVLPLCNPPVFLVARRER